MRVIFDNLDVIISKSYNTTVLIWYLKLIKLPKIKISTKKEPVKNNTYIF